MCAQSLGRVEFSRQFRLGQGRVDLVVADLMDKHARPFCAAFQTGDKVMLGLPHIRRNGP